MLENKDEILQKAKEWFSGVIAVKHISNTKKLTNPDEFNINPFMAVYLSNYLTGDSSAESIARALVYPRVLGTSITTSFGMNIQKFTGEVLEAFGSTTSGIDIEFTDQIDGRKKYCQLKSGPNTINSDDVETIAGHFTSVINLARTNNLNVSFNDMVVGVIYGEADDLNSHYKRVTDQYHFPVYAGSEFWKRLTGDDDFYGELLEAIGQVAVEADFATQLDEVIRELAASQAIQDLSNHD